MYILYSLQYLCKHAKILSWFHAHNRLLVPFQKKNVINECNSFTRVPLDRDYNGACNVPTGTVRCLKNLIFHVTCCFDCWRAGRFTIWQSSIDLFLWNQGHSSFGHEWKPIKLWYCQNSHANLTSSWKTLHSLYNRRTGNQKYYWEC